MNNLPGLKTILAVMVVCSCALLQSGCAVGYITFHNDSDNRELALPKLPEIKIAYSYAKPENNAKLDTTFPLAFERTLRGRFHILDLKDLASAEDNDTERFVIHIKKKAEDPNPAELVYAGVSMFSLAIIPFVMSGDTVVVFTVRSPWGKEKIYQYSYTERVYSWLPFALFAPGMSATVQAGHDYYEEERLKMFEDITTRLMIESAPFITEQYHQHVGAGRKSS